MSSFRPLHNHKGTSLIEILVALVIFLVGIVSIVRLFPGGFVTMQHSENVTLANRMAQAEIERWQARPANLPAGILAWGQDPSNPSRYDIWSNVHPEQLDDSIAPGDYYFTGVNRFRRIHAESTKIPMPQLDAGGAYAGCIYVLAFSPISPIPADDPLVFGGQMKRLTLPQDPDDLRINAHGEYAINYRLAELYLMPFARERQLILNYSYWISDGSSSMNLQHSLRQIIVVPEAVATDFQNGFQVVRIPSPVSAGDLSAETGFREIDRDSESIHRRFIERPVNADGTVNWYVDDPYEFALVTERAGVISFNPVGYGYEEITARGKEALTAYIDYTVLDWHILSEERKLPDTMTSPTDWDVKLTLGFLKKKGETVQQDGSTYAGLSPSILVDPVTSNPYDILVIDMDTGQGYTELSVISGRPALEVDYKSGIVRFDPNLHQLRSGGASVPSPFDGGKTFKIYYRADNDWALQPYKSYENYRERPDAASVGYRSFFKQYTGSGQYCTLYFPKCYAGTSVAVDYWYQLQGEQDYRYASGEVHQISDFTGAHDLCYIDLRDTIVRRHGSSAVLNSSSPAPVRISRVYGVSLGVRVVWRETGRGFQAGRWKKINLQTYLTNTGKLSP